MRKYYSLWLFSATGIALEVTLTRLLSTLYYPPFIFVVLSLAVFGIALGSAWILIEEYLLNDDRIPLWIAASGIGVIVQVIGLPWSATLSSPLITSLLLILPFIGIGVSITSIFTLSSDKSQQLYSADLIGAGAGAILVILLLNLLNPLNAMLVIACMMFIAGVLYRKNIIIIVLFPLMLIFTAGNIATNFIAIDLSNLSSEKPIQSTLRNGGEIVYTRHDAFARTDLVVPSGNQPWRLYVDGAAASTIPPAANNEFLIQDIGLFAFVTARPDNVFIIGSGGGLDVWFGLQVGAHDITAVEVNRQSVSLVNDIQRYSGDIYTNPAVRVFVDEGRSVLQREEKVYNLIYLSQVVTLSAESSGYALTENAVFTVEAFEEYWDHLADDGYLALKLYDEVTTTRALSLVIELLNRRGFNDRDALHHTITLLAPQTNPATPMLIVRKSAFSEEEAIRIGSIAQQVGFVSLYLPYIQADPPLDTIEDGTISFDDLISLSTADLSPPTDNRPFFYQMEKGIPRSLYPVLSGATIVLIVVIAGVVIYNYRRNSSQPLVIPFLYFAGLGSGFMAVELLIIQTTRLFIGHPTLAITASLSTILIVGGLGSGWYYRRNPNPDTMPARFVIGIVLALIIWQFVWQILSPLFVTTPVILRIAIAILSITPVAFLMGIPFAVGLRIIEESGKNHVVIAWLINGVFTVIGTVASVTLALLYGYFFVFVFACICYLIVATTTMRFHKIA